MKERINEIKKLLTDNPETIEVLCNLPEDRYQIVIESMQLVKLLEYQRVDSNDVLDVYLMRDSSKIALMAFVYGKIQGKREERSRRK